MSFAFQDREIPWIGEKGGSKHYKGQDVILSFAIPREEEIVESW